MTCADTVNTEARIKYVSKFPSSRRSGEGAYQGFRMLIGFLEA
jgi:hypothetical protein